MSKITFLYRGNNYIIQSQEKAKMSSAIEGFYNKTQIQRDSVYFICNGDIVDNEMTEDKIHLNEQNQKIILVYDINNQSNEQIIKSNQVICKICKENAKIGVDNYHIVLFGCKNNHRINNIHFKEFAQTQFINLSKIICEFCKNNNMGESYNKRFSRCLTCKKNICLLCQEKHSSEHNVINYDQKNYICEEHAEYYHSFCYTCNKNLCTSCENIHKNHIMESFGTMIKERSALLEEREQLRKNIERVGQIISDIITKLNKVRENLGIYYEIHRNIISNNNKFRNYEILFNINEFNNNAIKKDLETIINDNNTSNQLNTLMNIYKKMETEVVVNSNNDKKISAESEDSDSEINFNLINDTENNINQKKDNIQQQQNNNNNINSNNLSKSANKIIQKEENQDLNDFNKKRSAMIFLKNELQNILLEENNKLPLISELNDINQLLKNYKDNSPEIDMVKTITNRYKKYRLVRNNGNSFYTCFIYRLFEYISLNRQKNLYDKIYKKILDGKLVILNNDYDWEPLKDSYNVFKNEFNACYEKACESLKKGREYLDDLFQIDQITDYLNHFIHFCIAAYIKENKILYEEYVTQDFNQWIRNIEEIGLECDQLVILACANYFDVGIKIEYLYPTQVKVEKFPEDKKGEEIFINILFRPDHYDILYKDDN